MNGRIRTTADTEAIPDSLINDVCARLAAGKQVKQPLPGGGILEMDRLLPFLCLYRRNPNRRDEGTVQLVLSEASFLCAPGAAEERLGLRTLVRRIAATVAGRLGAFLLVEIWSATDQAEVDPTTGETKLPGPAFRIAARRPHSPDGTVATLEFALQQIRVHRKPAAVQVVMDRDNHPAGMKPLISHRVEREINCYVLGLEVAPLYRDPDSGEVYDRVIRAFRRELSHGLKKAFYTFALKRTSVRPEHYFCFGSSRLSKQVLAVDRQLADISRQFKFLLLVTPINAQRAWIDFSSGGYRKAPAFHYRPLDADPMLLKRRITRIATERIVDPPVSYIFRQTQFDLDRQINMLADIGTERFLHGSVQVFGGVKPTLRRLADAIIRSSIDSPAAENTATVGSRRFLGLVKQELEFYRRQSSVFTANATVRDDIYAGMLVTGGELLIGSGSRISRNRANALLQHEVGTHLVTYYNGAAQPLRLLQVGLADYDAFQEGLAVLSEYLVGGLTVARLRTLAARVIAVDMVLKGIGFVDVFQRLVDELGFEPRAAYTIALRVFRGGGLTKDALYLRGLVEILEYLSGGGELQTALVGKIAAEHIPIVRELTLTGVLSAPPLRPRYLESRDAIKRLKKLADKTSVLDLLARQ